MIIYLEKHMKPVNTIREQNAEFLVVKARGTQSYHWFLKFNLIRIWTRFWTFCTQVVVLPQF
jgi:hypothetical protein